MLSKQTRITSTFLLSTVSALSMNIVSAFANPEGGVVAAGAADIAHAGSTMNITQQTNRAIINWNSFSINAGETVNIMQPGQGAALLNRVVGDSASMLNGALNANGRVYLINQNGIVVGPGGTINAAGGFTASTLDVNNGKFMNEQELSFEGSSTQNIRVLGKITATNGDVVLVAREIDNQGSIKAGGKAGLYAGEVILNSGGVTVKPGQDTQGKITNGGDITAVQAELTAVNNNVAALAINNTGTIRANVLSETNDGRIVLSATNGKIENSGMLDASNANGKGGTIHVLADEITNKSTARIDASGKTGGGEILIGGDKQGKNTAIKNAQKNTVEQGALISADAIDNGDGGKVIVWSDDTTKFAGHISARGGANGGNGGFAEISGKQHLNLAGHADMRAPHGKFGSVLFDPGSVDIVSGPNAPSGTDDVFNDAYIVDQLSLGDVTISTSGSSNGFTEDLTVDGAAFISWGDATMLTLDAGHDLNIFGVVESTLFNGNGQSMQFFAGNDINIDSGAFIAAGGSIFGSAGNAINSGTDLSSYSADSASNSIFLTAGAGGINVGNLNSYTGGTAGGIVLIADGDINTGFVYSEGQTSAGFRQAIFIRSNNGVVTGDSFYASGTNAGGISVTAAGDITVNGDVISNGYEDSSHQGIILNSTGGSIHVVGDFGTVDVGGAGTGGAVARAAQNITIDGDVYSDGAESNFNQSISLQAIAGFINIAGDITSTAVTDGGVALQSAGNITAGDFIGQGKESVFNQAFIASSSAGAVTLGDLTASGVNSGGVVAQGLTAVNVGNVAATNIDYVGRSISLLSNTSTVNAGTLQATGASAGSIQVRGTGNITMGTVLSEGKNTNNGDAIALASFGGSVIAGTLTTQTAGAGNITISAYQDSTFNTINAIKGVSIDMYGDATLNGLTSATQARVVANSITQNGGNSIIAPHVIVGTRGNAGVGSATSTVSVHADRLDVERIDAGALTVNDNDSILVTSAGRATDNGNLTIRAPGDITFTGRTQRTSGTGAITFVADSDSNGAGGFVGAAADVTLTPIFGMLMGVDLTGLGLGASITIDINSGNPVIQRVSRQYVTRGYKNNGDTLSQGEVIAVTDVLNFGALYGTSAATVVQNGGANLWTVTGYGTYGQQKQFNYTSLGLGSTGTNPVNAGVVNSGGYILTGDTPVDVSVSTNGNPNFNGRTLNMSGQFYTAANAVGSILTVNTPAANPGSWSGVGVGQAVLKTGTGALTIRTANHFANASNVTLTLGTTLGNLDLGSNGGDILIDPPMDLVVNGAVNSGGGDMTMIASRNFSFSATGSMNSGGGQIVLVSDDLTGAVVGAGAFTMAAGSSIVSGGGDIRLYSSTQGPTNILGTIAGGAFTEGTEYLDTSTEVWNTFFNSHGSPFAGPFNGAFTSPYTVFYKDTGVPVIPPPPSYPNPPTPDEAVVETTVAQEEDLREPTELKGYHAVVCDNDEGSKGKGNKVSSFDLPFRMNFNIVKALFLPQTADKGAKQGCKA